MLLGNLYTLDEVEFILQKATIAACKEALENDEANENELVSARDDEIKAAVLAERKACAKIVESVNNFDNPMTANDCAEAIRARSKE